MKILLIVLDGIADRAIDVLKGQTPLQVAHTPNFDKLAKQGALGLLFPTEPFWAPSSELAHFQLFGYEGTDFPGRAYLEALGEGLKLKEDSLVLKVNLAAVSVRGQVYEVLERHPTAEEEEFKVAFSVAREALRGLAELVYLRRGEGFMLLERAPSAAFTDSDPFFSRMPVLEVRAVKKEGEELAQEINSALRQVFFALESQQLNKQRKVRGAPPLNFLLTKWSGMFREAIPFSQKYGLEGASVATGSLFAGIAKYLKLDYAEVKEDQPQTELREKIEVAFKLLETHSFVHVNCKTADVAAHQGEPHQKVAAIEAFDHVVGELLTEVSRELILAITADHATPTQADLIHSGDPCPFLVLGRNVPSDEVGSFDELACSKGFLQKIKGKDVMPLLLNYSDRVGYQGGQPLPFKTPAKPTHLNIKPLRIEG
jgi:2,3-bisphosphoglycerate-independent phosphoglycerate mutase